MPKQEKLPKHHYIPVFYLNQWATKGRLIEFSRPYRSFVKARPTSPEGTGYVRGLNVMKGLPPHSAEQFETVVMRYVDSLAADALRKLLSGDDTQWAPKPRSAWTRFLVSLLLRTPEALNRMKAFLKDYSAPGTQESRALYEAEKRPGDVDFEEFLLRYGDQAAFQTVLQVLNSQEIGTHINNMIWNVVTVRGTKHEILTSDRPLIVTGGLGGPNASMILPICPTKVFVSVNEEAELARIERRSANDLVQSANRGVVSNAIKYVWGRDNRQLRFVQNHMSSMAQHDLALMPNVGDRP